MKVVFAEALVFMALLGASGTVLGATGAVLGPSGALIADDGSTSGEGPPCDWANILTGNNLLVCFEYLWDGVTWQIGDACNRAGPTCGLVYDQYYIVLEVVDSEIGFVCDQTTVC